MTNAEMTLAIIRKGFEVRKSWVMDVCSAVHSIEVKQRSSVSVRFSIDYRIPRSELDMLMDSAGAMELVEERLLRQMYDKIVKEGDE
jgi:hypothetical protein